MHAPGLRIRGVVGAAVLGTMLLGGCGAFQDPPEPTRLTAPPATSQSQTPSAAAEFTIVDSMFSQMMIPHHEQALEMAALVPERTENPELRTLAEEIAAAQGPEIERMRAWLQEWGLPTEIDLEEHEDHLGMEGMLTQERLDALTAARGPEFDRLWLESMIEHHEGAVVMAETQEAAGVHEPSRGLAREIIAAQEAEVARMRAMLAG